MKPTHRPVCSKEEVWCWRLERECVLPPASPWHLRKIKLVRVLMINWREIYPVLYSSPRGWQSPLRAGGRKEAAEGWGGARPSTSQLGRGQVLSVPFRGRFRRSWKCTAKTQIETSHRRGPALRARPGEGGGCSLVQDWSNEPDLQHRVKEETAASRQERTWCGPEPSGVGVWRQLCSEWKYLPAGLWWRRLFFKWSRTTLEIGSSHLRRCSKWLTFRFLSLMLTSSVFLITFRTTLHLRDGVVAHLEESLNYKWSLFTFLGPPPPHRAPSCPPLALETYSLHVCMLKCVHHSTGVAVRPLLAAIGYLLLLSESGHSPASPSEPSQRSYSFPPFWLLQS